MKKFLTNQEVLKMLTPNATLNAFENGWLNGLQRNYTPQELLSMEEKAKLKVQMGQGDEQFLTSTKHKVL